MLHRIIYRNGMLHTWKSKPRNKTFRRALAMRAIFWAGAQIPRASMAAQATLTCLCTRRSVANAQVTCLRHSSNGRPICAAQKFPREQVSSDVPPAQKMGDPSRRARMPARLRIWTACTPRKSIFCRPRSAPIAREHPTIIYIFDSHRRRRYHRRQCSLLIVVCLRMLGPGEPVKRTESDPSVLKKQSM